MGIFGLLAAFAAPIINWVVQQPIVQQIIKPIVQAVQKIFSGQAGGSSSSSQSRPMSFNSGSPSSGASPRANAQLKPHTLHDIQDETEFGGQAKAAAPRQTFAGKQSPPPSTEDIAVRAHPTPIEVDVLNLLGHPDAKRVIHVLTHVGSIVTAVIDSGKSPLEAMNFLLAEAVLLTEDEIALLIAHHKSDAKIKAPAGVMKMLPPHMPPQQNDNWWESAPKIEYKMKKGETLTEVAKRFHLPVDTLLQEINPGLNYSVKEGDTILVPIPGWVNYPGFGWAAIVDPNQPGPRTTIQTETGYVKDLATLQVLWSKLTIPEQNIEIALGLTAADWQSASFRHVAGNDLDYATQLLTSPNSNYRVDQIKQISSRFGVDPSLVAGILASEVIYDLAFEDEQQNRAIRRGADLRGFWNLPDTPKLARYRDPYRAVGIARADLPTLQQAYTHIIAGNPAILLNQFRAGNPAILPLHPWDRLGGPTLWDKNTPQGLSSQDLGNFGETATGSIAEAAMIARMLTDFYTAGGKHNPANLSAADKAVIWAAYRAGINGVTRNDGKGFQGLADYQSATDNMDIRPNAQLALPVMDYFSEVFQ